MSHYPNGQFAETLTSLSFRRRLPGLVGGLQLVPLSIFDAIDTSGVATTCEPLDPEDPDGPHGPDQGCRYQQYLRMIASGDHVRIWLRLSVDDAGAFHFVDRPWDHLVALRAFRDENITEILVRAQWPAEWPHPQDARVGRAYRKFGGSWYEHVGDRGSLFG